MFSYSEMTPEQRLSLYHHLTDALRNIADGIPLCMPWMKDQWEENLGKLKEVMIEKGELRYETYPNTEPLTPNPTTHGQN